MAEGSHMKAAGRRAGLAYLVIVVFCSPAYMTLASLLTGDSHVVLARLTASQSLFTLALIANVMGFAAWVVLGILLYRLMSSAGRLLGLLMLTLALAGTAANLIALSRLVPLLGLARSGMDAGALASIVHSYNHLLQLAQIFSGLWLFPFAWLILRSRIAPRPLAICLIAGGFFYLLQFATAFDPNLEHMVLYQIASTATGIPGVVGGELGTCLWLLIKGARDAAAPVQPRGAPATT